MIDTGKVVEEDSFGAAPINRCLWAAGSEGDVYGASDGVKTTKTGGKLVVSEMKLNMFFDPGSRFRLEMTEVQFA